MISQLNEHELISGGLESKNCFVYITKFIIDEKI